MAEAIETKKKKTKAVQDEKKAAHEQKKKAAKVEKEARLHEIVKTSTASTLTAELGDIQKQMEEIMAQTRLAEEERERLRLLAEQLEEERRSKERLMEQVHSMRTSLRTWN